MKRKILCWVFVLAIAMTACGGKNEDPTISSDDIVSEVSKALETAQTTAAAEDSEQAIADKLFEISNWLTLDVWNKGFCDISHYIGRGKSSTGETLDIEYTLRKLDTTMEKAMEYDAFIVGLPDEDRFEEMKYIWTEKLYPEINNLYSDIQDNKPEAEDLTRSFETSLYKTYSSDFSSQSKIIRDEIAEKAAE